MPNLQPHIRLVVGLGNPGTQYATTWHNLGFLTVDCLVDSLRETWSNKADFASAEHRLRDHTLHVLKPLRYMNLSGEVLGPYAHKKGLEGTQTIVVHDEVDLPLGTIRLKWAGGSGGHRGIENIISHWGPNFYRLRVGVGKDPVLSTSDHVLKKQDTKAAAALAQKAYEALQLVLNEGPAKAINTINRA